jgi:hypothetical protein
VNRAQAAAFAGAMTALRPIRGRAALVITVCTVGFTTIASYAERRVAVADAASRALQGPTFGIAIPFAALALVSAALTHRRLDDAMTPAALLGADRRVAALGAALALIVVAAALGIGAASCSALVAHGPASAGSVRDALTAGWVGGLTAATYTAVLLAASGFGARGGWRLGALAVDLIIGPMATPVAALVPRSHALNLLGALDVAPGFSQPASSLAMLAVIAVSGAVMLSRVRS